MVPIFINSFIYQDYINIDDQSMYENQIKSATVTLQEKVDLSQSEIYWNDQKMNISNHRFEIRIDQEGNNTLSYVLKDEKGEVLEENSNTIVLDTKSPVIHVSCEGYEIVDDVYVMDSLSLDIRINDENLESYSIVLDGIKQESNQVMIDKNHKELVIDALDKAGNQISKTIVIHSMDSIFPNLNIEDGAYTLEPIQMTWNQNLETDVTMYISGSYNETLHYGNTSQEMYQPNQKGTYSMYFQSDLYPYLKSKVIHFTYTNEKPEIELNADSKLSNDTITIQCLKNSEFIKESWISINGMKEEWSDEVKLNAVENEDITYTIEAYILDQFGQEVSKDIQVRMDKKLPDFNISANHILLSDTFEYDSIQQLEILSEVEASYVVNYVYNGAPIQIFNLESFLNSMNINDTLISTYTITDEAGNQVQKSYTWKKIGIIQNLLKEDTVVKTEEENEEEVEKLDIPIVETKVEDYQNGYIQYRTWTLDENQNVVLQKEKKLNTRKSKVLILANKKLKKGDTIRVVFMKYSANSNDDIVWIKLNGKKVKGHPWKVDTLGNVYYSFKIQKDVSIEVKVKRESGEIYRYKKKLKLQKQTEMKHENWFHQFKDKITEIFYG